jgi:uncharacterized protein
MKQFLAKCLLSLLCVAGALGQSALVMSLPFFSTEAVAQTSPPPTEPASREDVQNLFAVLKLDRMMQVTMLAAAEQMKTNLPDLMRQQNIEIPKDQLDALTEDIFHDYPMKAVLDSMIPVYQNHLNKGDVANILAFYQSPTGQKMLNEMPEMSKEAMQAANPVMKEWMSSLMQRMQDRARSMAQQNTSQKPETNSKPK